MHRFSRGVISGTLNYIFLFFTAALFLSYVNSYSFRIRKLSKLFYSRKNMGLLYLYYDYYIIIIVTDV